jgi:hypothetical protein
MKKWVDWSDWKPGQGEPESSLSQPLKKTGKGKDIVSDQVKDFLISDSKISNPGKQPTNEELFGHLVVTEKQATEHLAKWENTFNDFFSLASIPVEKQDPLVKVGRGPIHKEVLTEEEERIRAIPVNSNLFSAD